MSLDTGNQSSLENGAFLFMSARMDTSRRTELQLHGPEPTDAAAVEKAVSKIRSTCPLLGECALSATCQEVKYDEPSPHGWMQTETQHFLRVVTDDNAVNCPTPNAHLDVFNAVAEARGHEPYELEA